MERESPRAQTINGDEGVAHVGSIAGPDGREVKEEAEAVEGAAAVSAGDGPAVSSEARTARRARPLSRPALHLRLSLAHLCQLTSVSG